MFGVAEVLWDWRVDCAAPGFLVAVPAAVRQKAITAAQDESFQMRAVGGDQREQVCRDRRQKEQLKMDELERHARQNELCAGVVRLRSF